jgi:hypothetical protein
VTGRVLCRLWQGWEFPRQPALELDGQPPNHLAVRWWLLQSIVNPGAAPLVTIQSPPSLGVSVTESSPPYPLASTNRSDSDMRSWMEKYANKLGLKMPGMSSPSPPTDFHSYGSR